MEPLTISVVIPVFDKAPYVGAAIRSVLDFDAFLATWTERGTSPAIPSPVPFVVRR